MRFILLAFLAYALALHPSTGTGHEPTGILRGVVRDRYEAVVPGANLVIQSWKSDIKNSGTVAYTINSVLVTDGIGQFTLPLEEGR